MKLLWLRAPLVKSDGDSKDATPKSLVLLKREFPLSVDNLNILLEGLCKNLEYGKTVILLREGRLLKRLKMSLRDLKLGSGPLLRVRSKQCSNSGFNTIENIGRLLLFNYFSSVQRFKEFSASNTISTVDEPYKGLSNLVKLAPAGELCSYLDDLANSLDIQTCIRECVWTAGD
ncbi:hypothetical protein HID58_059154 [Brassica napus]|uniref:Uncharacterized protein n=1 Tax=Brassica napus TaxID=3708 RepID=A0ABQ7ZSR2_BRANA|nr:hypothetical protein HID58_059154 [Brassica napus]